MVRRQPNRPSGKMGKVEFGMIGFHLSCSSFHFWSLLFVGYDKTCGMRVKRCGKFVLFRLEYRNQFTVSKFKEDTNGEGQI
jgi:hypothetical protein